MSVEKKLKQLGDVMQEVVVVCVCVSVCVRTYTHTHTHAHVFVSVCGNETWIYISSDNQNSASTSDFIIPPQWSLDFKSLY